MPMVYARGQTILTVVFLANHLCLIIQKSLKEDHPNFTSHSHKPTLMYSGQGFNANTALEAISYCCQKHCLAILAAMGIEL